MNYDDYNIREFLNHSYLLRLGKVTPVIPVVKSNGETKLCGDYYKCTGNKVLNIYPYPVSAVNQILAELLGGRHFIKLDLSPSIFAIICE